MSTDTGTGTLYFELFRFRGSFSCAGKRMSWGEIEIKPYVLSSNEP